VDYISIAEAAAKWDITRRRVQVLCNEGRIPGLEKPKKAWTIPQMPKTCGYEKDKVRKIGQTLREN